MSLTLIESIARRDRQVLIATLIAIPLLCWAWIVPMAHDMYGAMTGPAAWMMTTVWDARHLALLCAMWIAMMVGMMLPSAAPTLLTYADVMRRSNGPRSALRVYPMAAGYVLVWVGFSLGATLMQRLLTRELALSPMMKLATPAASALLLMLASMYQMAPVKRTCLDSCRVSAALIAEQMRRGAVGAFFLGLRQGVYCLGCCWALMLLLFAGGIMNLAVIASLAAFVLLEKLAPLGRVGAWLSAVFLAAIAVWIVMASA
jgi:predicted metal-binding membrane protein